MFYAAKCMHTRLHGTVRPGEKYEIGKGSGGRFRGLEAGLIGGKWLSDFHVCFGGGWVGGGGWGGRQAVR
jgi:hypothetical protein